jgi:hypothetical protein
VPSAEYQREWRRRNPSKHAGYLQKYRETHRAQINATARSRYRTDNGIEKSRRWAKANPDKIRAAKRKYLQTTHGQTTARVYHLHWRTTRPILRLLQQARARAKKQGIPFTLTESDISLPIHCPVLGMVLTKGCGINTPGSPTLDRIDNGKGYVPGNVMVISYKANTMKSDASFDQLRRFAAFYQQLLGPVV